MARVATLTGHTGYITSLCVDPVSGRFASTSNDGTIKIWSNWRCVKTISHSAVLSCFDPKRGYLATWSWDKTIKIWDVSSGRCIRTMIRHVGCVSALCFDPASGHLASGHINGMIRFWDILGGRRVQTLIARAEGVLTSLCFDPTGDFLASGFDNGTIKLWKAPRRDAKGRVGEWTWISTLTGHTSYVRSLCFDPMSGILVSGSWNEIKVSGVKTHMKIFTHSLCFDPVNGYLFGISNDGIEVWDTSEKVVSHLATINTRSNVLCFDPHGHLITGSMDGTITVWDVSSKYMCKYSGLFKTFLGQTVQLTLREKTLYFLLQTYLPAELAVMGM